MNPTFHQLYIELLSGIKSYIGQEYPHSGAVVANPDNFNYFKAQALRAAPGPKSTAPTVSIQVIEPKTVTPLHAAPTLPQTVKPTAAPLLIAVKDALISAPQASDLHLEKKVEKAEKVILERSLNREQPDIQKASDFNELRKLWQQQCPQVPLIDIIPSDEKSKIISERWRSRSSSPGVVLLYFSENSREKAFLTNIAAAISLHFVSAEVMSASKIEADRTWAQLVGSPSLRLLIAQHHSFETLPELSKIYREDTARGHHTLGRIPLFLLSDLSLYMREPKLKISLWQTLCQKLEKKHYNLPQKPQFNLDD